MIPQTDLWFSPQPVHIGEKQKRKTDLVTSKTHKRKDTSALAVVVLGAVVIFFSMTVKTPRITGSRPSLESLAG